MNVLRRSPALPLGRARAADVLASVRPPLWPRLALGSAVLAGALLLGLALGPVAVPLDATVRVLWSHLPWAGPADLPAVWGTIVWDVRLPRVLLAGAVGAALATAGATYQGVFRNPLADPYLIGVATGAALAATIVIVSDAPVVWHGLSVLPLASFAGAIASVALVYAVARTDGVAPVTTLVLAGVAVASLSTAVTSYLMLKDTSSALTVLSVVLGGFNTASWSKLLWMLPYALPACTVVLAYARVLNVLALDEEQARHLGIDVEWAKVVLLGAASLAAAAAVSVSGTIGFVGLVVPHAVRLIWGPDHRHLLPLSMLYGGAFLIGADLLARTVDQPSEVPVGIVTAVCGVPFFLYLLRRAKGAYSG